MKRALAAVFSALVLGCSDAPTEPRLLSPDGPSLAALSVTTNVITPIAIAVGVPCAGEIVNLTGNIHNLFHITVSNSGNVTIKQHFQPQGVSGTGAVSGDKYQGTGVTQTIAHPDGPPPFTTTFVNNFRIIGQGPGNNAMVHVNTHVTVNANGEVTATVNNANASCK